jgi:DNA-directed RNA polymerase specialized sigma24 family protein
MDVVGARELEQRLARLQRADDPAVIAAVTTDVLETLRLLQQGVSQARDAAVLALSRQGMTLHDIARTTGLTRGRVFQIVQRGREPGPAQA